MKFIKQGLFLLVFLLTVSIPITTYAAGEGNIDHGGGMLGEGTGINFWSSHDEGVRVTVVRASDGAVVSASIDLTNKQPTDIRVHFGKVSKTAYRNGTGLSACMGGYIFYNPAQHLPQIISTSNGGANLTAIKQYFTDEQIIRAIAGYVGMDFQTLVNGEYKLLLEPVAYVTFEGVRTAFTATEAAKYNQLRGGMIRKKMPSLSHKNLPLAMFLEISDLGYPAWSGSRTEKAGDEDIIRALGLGIVRFNETITPEVIQADYTYRVDTDVITAVTVSGGQSDPDNSVSVTFSILGRNYSVGNVYYPEGGQQLVWVKWHTPQTEQHLTIHVTVSGGGTASKGTISANIVNLDQNPPPNPVADDRNDAYRRENAIVPVNTEKTEAAWSVWRPWWKENWVWHSDWNWEDDGHSGDCAAGCTEKHGHWDDDGEYKDEGWWEFAEDHYSASLSATMELVTDETSPTADGSTIKSGYGVNVFVNTRASTSQSSATTAPQTAVSYFPEFYYERYWRLLDRTKEDIMKIWIDGVYIGAAYVAAGLVAAYQSPDYLKEVFKKNVDEQLPGVRFDIESGDHALQVRTTMAKEITGYTNDIKSDINRKNFGFVFSSENAVLKDMNIQNIMVYKARNLLTDGKSYEPIYKTQVTTYIQRVMRLATGDFKQENIVEFFSSKPTSQRSRWMEKKDYINAIIGNGDDIKYSIDETAGYCTLDIAFNGNVKNLEIEINRVNSEDRTF